MELYKWIPCEDGNYWTDEEGYMTLVQVFFSDGSSSVFTQCDCPYGWNVICKMNGKLMNIKLCEYDTGRV